jgi:DNA repair exonuclease SbcCD ATPase subunit
MSMPVRLRRPFVILGVVLTLLAGAATIRAAAAWTAASSPLVDKPPSVEALQASLAVEQARSADLQAQLDQLTAGSTDLAAALATARERILADAADAEQLRASLSAAKDKLATLEGSIRQARAAANASVAANPAPAVATSVPGDHDDEDDREEEDDD